MGLDIVGLVAALLRTSTSEAALRLEVFTTQFPHCIQQQAGCYILIHAVVPTSQRLRLCTFSNRALTITVGQLILEMEMEGHGQGLIRMDMEGIFDLDRPYSV